MPFAAVGVCRRAALAAALRLLDERVLHEVRDRAAEGDHEPHDQDEKLGATGTCGSRPAHPGGGVPGAFGPFIGLTIIGIYLLFDKRRQFVTAGGVTINEGDWITLDGSTGEVIATAVSHFFADPTAQALIAKFRRHGLRMDEPRQASVDGALKGKTVVITGTLPTLSRADATALIAQLGRDEEAARRALTLPGVFPNVPSSPTLTSPR